MSRVGSVSLLKVLIIKKLFFFGGDFSPFYVVFLSIFAFRESYITPRWPIGVQQGRGGSHRESSLLHIGTWESFMTPSRTATHLFIVIRIRDKGTVPPVWDKIKYKFWIILYHKVDHQEKGLYVLYIRVQ
jgi:hypothetical protein